MSAIRPLSHVRRFKLQSLEVPRRPYPFAPVARSSLRGTRSGRSGHLTQIQSDSRHLLGLGQALLRRGKQMSVPNAWRATCHKLTHEVRSRPTPALLWVSILATVASDPRPLLQTTVCVHLVVLESELPRRGRSAWCRQQGRKTVV